VSQASLDPRPAPPTPVDVQEDPDHRFAATAAALERHAAQGDWTMHFNAMILTHAVLRAERGDANKLTSIDPESLLSS